MFKIKKVKKIGQKLGLIFIFISLTAIANDGAYYASGNQLIPITETEICVTKEILTIGRKKIDFKDYIYVTVDYTFFNPGNDKTILVGFEAPSPSGDVNGYPKNGAHPYISNFNVKMNEENLAFKTSIVNTDDYYVNNEIQGKTEKEVIDNDFNSNSPDFYYVYHFNANFKSGVNKIIHTYKFDISSSILNSYNFDYILTAATRWANSQIDDFTLHINLGANTGYDIKNTFFNNKNEWFIDQGRSLSISDEFTRFITHKGGITFKRKNFSPDKELYLSSIGGPMKDNYRSFDHKIHNLPIQINFKRNTCTNSVDENSFKILRNLPFANRGYVFKTKLIQDYYLSQIWYKPNSNYKANLSLLPEEEKQWLRTVKLNEWDKKTSVMD